MRILIVILLLIVVAFSCGTRPPVQVRKADNCCLDIDIQKLGEYATMVEQIEISEIKNDEVIWMARPIPGEVARIAILRLCAGSNPIAPRLTGTAEALQYYVYGQLNRDSFFLIENEEYCITIVSPEHRRPANVKFRFECQEGTPK